ncbi:hypothetical protein ACFOG5_08850 [Pedobacter fastidiosus]|uniref:hypothetical protein n=1 Tax=Pedobacter fastidiosus TaxID=2765361 RepID=UPI00362377AD
MNGPSSFGYVLTLEIEGSLSILPYKECKKIQLNSSSSFSGDIKLQINIAILSPNLMCSAHTKKAFVV